MADGESVDDARRHLRTAVAAYRRFATAAEDMDRACPTRLAAWTVGDLIDHVRWGAAMEADALRAAAGLPPDDPAGDLNEAVAAFARAADIELTADATVTVPAGSVPAAFAAALFGYEAALHASDLHHAKGWDATLSATEIDAAQAVLGPMLDLLGAEAPREGVTIDLIGAGDPIRVATVPDATTWERSTPDHNAPATTTIMGTAEEVILFVSGRSNVAGLEVTGVVEHAERFKTYFPGP